MPYTTIPITTSHSSSLNHRRQNHTRLRATTSSSRSASSAPKRLGHGMKRRSTTSTRPRNAITSRNVPSSDQPTLHPCTWCSQTKAAGAVRTATTVATRVRRRHSAASCSVPDRGWTSAGTGDSVAIG